MQYVLVACSVSIHRLGACQPFTVISHSRHLECVAYICDLTRLQIFQKYPTFQLTSSQVMELHTTFLLYHNKDVRVFSGFVPMANPEICFRYIFDPFHLATKS
jgi:hypothetical protein